MPVAAAVPAAPHAKIPSSKSLASSVRAGAGMFCSEGAVPVASMVRDNATISDRSVAPSMLKMAADRVSGYENNIYMATHHSNEGSRKRTRLY